MGFKTHINQVHSKIFFAESPNLSMGIFKVVGPRLNVFLEPETIFSAPLSSKKLSLKKIQSLNMYYMKHYLNCYMSEAYVCNYLIKMQIFIKIQNFYISNILLLKYSMYANGNVTQMSILLFYKFIDFCFYFIHSSESKISHIKNNRHKYP